MSLIGNDETSSAAGPTFTRALAIVNRIRGWLVPIVVLAGLGYFASLIQPQLPIQNWFIWRYFLYWAITLIWMAACFSSGQAILHRVLRSPLPVLEQITLSFALGVLSFFMLMFAGGLAGLYGTVFFCALPLVMLVSGARPSFVYLRRLQRLRARKSSSLGLWSAGLWGIGLIALFLFYLPAVVPGHIGYDSSWYHLPLAEHYARLGRIERFPEGWFPGAMPHLASVIYCFAFLLPHGHLFDYVELCGHLEFAITLMMLPGIPALVRRLAPGARAHASWVAFFAFPGVFWYDLIFGGDQFAALWCAPICLTLLRVLPNLDRRHGLLLAAMIAGETLTKYSGSGILVGPALALGLRTLWLGSKAVIQRRSLSAAGRPLADGGIIGAAVLLLTTPLWAKNWIWYGDPFYPVLYRHLSGRPWSADASVFFGDYLREMHAYQPQSGWAGVKESFYSGFNHALVPADFSPAPLRGALFTLMCASLPFLRAPWRLWCTAAVMHIAAVAWYVQVHQDRYLIAYMPGMAAVAAAAAILAWRVSLAARLSVIALFAFHSVCCLSIFSLDTPLAYYRGLIDFIVAARNGAADAGLWGLARWERLGKAIPAGSKVLAHGMHGHTGLGHPSVSDYPRFQGGLVYGRLDSPRAIYDKLRSFGVTHLIWEQNWAEESIAGDLRFLEFATKYTAPQQLEGMWLGTMPSTPPPGAIKSQLVAYMGCDAAQYAPGLYEFSAMTVPNPRSIPQPPYPTPLERLAPAEEDAALRRAQYAVLATRCGFTESPLLKHEFIPIGRRGEYSLFARKDPK
jgi:hypothetical protein